MSTRVRTVCKVNVYEIDGAEPKPFSPIAGVAYDLPVLAVSTDDIWEERVVLKIGSKEYTVVAADLILAIQRCSR